jgi:hypothetical protein
MLLEEEVSRLKNEVAKNQELVRSFSTEHSAGQILSNGEREILSARVRELMAKLDAYI